MRRVGCIGEKSPKGENKAEKPTAKGNKPAEKQKAKTKES